jgi:hypothetical protein
MERRRVAAVIVVLGMILARGAFGGDDDEDEVGGTKQAPPPTFKTSQEAMDAMKSRESKAPKAGDPAPDFLLHGPDGSKAVRLSSFKGVAPVILIFGSYT